METMNKKVVNTKRNLQPLTKEEFPILYAAEQRHKKYQENIKNELKAYIDIIKPDYYIPLLQIVKGLPFQDLGDDERIPDRL